MNKHTIALIFLLCVVYSYKPYAQKPAGQRPAADTFDFAPGLDVVFYDDFSGYKERSKPYRWSLPVHKRPDAVMPHSVEGYVTRIRDTSCYYSKACGFGTVIGRPDWDAVAYAAAHSNDHWTVEFDFRFTATTENCTRFIGLCFYHEQKEVDFDVYFECKDPGKPGLAVMAGDNMTFEIHSDGRYPQTIKNNEWHHFALLMTPQRVTGYIDRHKLITCPGVNYYLPGLNLLGGNVAFTNFRIAHTNPDAPASSAPDALLKEKKLVTHAINFDKNKWDIRPESLAFIAQLADFLKAHPGIKLQVCGHTDSDGTEASNRLLSQHRAEAIKKMLVSLGIDASRLSTQGFGAAMPITTNATPEGMALNRRVEFIKR